MMESETKHVDQALFGYSDGHRQLAASTRLASRDMYELAAASDLAAGVTLTADESYITGLPLRESDFYALIRTWPAPEMPRPGCVWSHVLLLGLRTLASHTDLEPLRRLFRRPHGANDDSYAHPLEFPQCQDTPNHCDFDGKADFALVERIVAQYYRGRPAVMDGASSPAALELAIFAVWSQQWPRLRGEFRFRTAVGAERSRATEAKFDVFVSQGSDRKGEGEIPESSKDWILIGARDAVCRQVTPLRRFLWRYGRDLRSPRRRYQTLIKFYEMLKGISYDDLPASLATPIFVAFPEPQDGQTLKRDILGIESPGSALVPSVSPAEMLKLVALSIPAADLVSDGELENRLSSMPPRDVPAAARSYTEFFDTNHRSAVIERSIAAIAEKTTVLDSHLPAWFRVQILAARPDLIDPETIGAIHIDDGLDLLRLMPDGMIKSDLLVGWMRSNPGERGSVLLKRRPSEALGAAVTAAQSDSLHPDWRPLFRQAANAILEETPLFDFRTTSALAAAANLLCFPLLSDAPRQADAWSEAIARATDDASSITRTSLLAYVTILAFRSERSTSLPLLEFAFADLRNAVLKNEIDDDTRHLLHTNLPDIRYSNWDIARRLWIALGEFLRSLKPLAGVGDRLKLSPADMYDLLRDREKEKESWTPYRWWW